MMSSTGSPRGVHEQRRPALEAARVLQFGTVWINDHTPIAAEMPHGGFKQSGNGEDMSVCSLEEYTEIKHMIVNLHHR